MDQKEYTKKPGWESRLVNYILSAKDRKFRWGTHDCVTFAFGAMNEVIGWNGFRTYKPRWKNKKEAVALLSQENVANWVEIVEREIEARGFRCVPMTMAQRGDLAVIETDQGPGMGVVYLNKVYYPGLRGLCEMKLKDAKRAWRYGG